MMPINTLVTSAVTVHRAVQRLADHVRTVESFDGDGLMVPLDDAEPGVRGDLREPDVPHR